MIFPPPIAATPTLVLNDVSGNSLRLHLYKPALLLTMDQKLRVARYVLTALIETFNIEGKLFVEDAEITRFWKRARDGEFAKKLVGAARKTKKS